MIYSVNIIKYIYKFYKMCEREEYYRMNFKRNFKNELLTTIATLLQDICEENDFSNLQNDDLIKPFIGKIENMSVEDLIKYGLKNLSR